MTLAACGPSGSGEDATPASAETSAEAAGPDTLAIVSSDTTLADRPTVPLRIDGACPFEGCTYGTWTTTAETTVYATPSASAESFTVPAGTVLNADTGFALVTEFGVAVAERDTEIYTDSERSSPVAAGDTLLVMDAEGEGSYRAWSGGRIAYTGTDGFLAPPGESAPLRQLSEPKVEWWAHVTMDDGREGWLWMDETPPVEGADAFG